MSKIKWTVDPLHSELGFKIKHLMISNVSGSFKDFSAEVEASGSDFSNAQIELRAKIGSITTNNAERDAHLLNSDFFEVEKYPELNFKSTKIEKVDDESYLLFGNLKMKDIEKEVKLNMEFNGIAKDLYGKQRAGFAVNGKIKRADWGMNFNGALETGGVVLSDEVKIFSEIQLVQDEVDVLA